MTTVRRDKARAQAAVRDHPLFQQLKKSFDSLDPVDRAEYVSQICRPEKRLIRALADALDVDPGTIRRDLEVDKLSAEQKAEIRSGKSVTEVLEAGKDKTTRPPECATAEEKVAQLQADIIRYFDRLDLGPAYTENILEYTTDELELMRGRIRGDKRSRMKLSDLLRYTAPKKEVDRSDHTQWFYGFAHWLLRWSPAREPEYEVLEAAMRGARHHFQQQPRGLMSYETLLRVHEDIARQQLADQQAIAMQGPESMRSPQSKIEHAACVKQKECERQERERREAAAAHEEYLTRMRQLLSGDKSAVEPPYARSEIKPTTIGEELERARQQGVAGAEQRVENTCKRMGWPEPGARPETAGTVEQALTPPTQPTNSRSSTGVAPDVKADVAAGNRDHGRPAINLTRTSKEDDR
ncbi:MAG TPA: hypothetical protein VF311_02175 [Terriglobales bacterium]